MDQRIGSNPIIISNGATLTSNVYGKIESNAKLTGRHANFSVGNTDNQGNDRHAGLAYELFESKRHDRVCLSSLRTASIVGSVVFTMS